MSRTPLATAILDVAADFPETDAAPKLRAIRILLLVHLTAELTISFLRWNGATGLRDPLLLALAAAAALTASFVPRAERFSAPAAALLLGWTLLRYFPNVANHTFLLFLGLVIVSFFDLRNREERGLCLSTLRWTAALVFFATGVQKMLHGTYFHGEFLAFQIAHGDRFAGFFGPLLPGEEFERLRRLGEAAGALAGPSHAYQTAPPVVGAGPYRLTSPFALAMTNSVWMFELVAPALLLWRSTRTLTVIAVVLFLGAIEVGAHELMFGVLFINFMLLFFRTNWIGRLLPVSAAAYAYLIGVQLGWFPQWFFN